MSRSANPSRRPARTHLAVLVFLCGFSLFLIFLSYYYLLPALETFVQARQKGDKAGTKAISATSALLMAIVLIILITGIILTFRIGRFFFPGKSEPRTRTQYVDAWAEAGKRATADDDNEAADDAPDNPPR